MVSKNKDRITVSLLKENIKYLDFEGKETNKTKSEIIDKIIENHLNDCYYSNFLKGIIVEKIKKQYNFKCYTIEISDISEDNITFTGKGGYYVIKSMYKMSGTINIKGGIYCNFNEYREEYK